jgi:PAS domain S-box-containing protein
VDRTFADLPEAAPDALVCVAGRGRITAVNAQAEKLFGYPRAGLAGHRRRPRYRRPARDPG